MVRQKNPAIYRNNNHKKLVGPDVRGVTCARIISACQHFLILSRVGCFIIHDSQARVMDNQARVMDNQARVMDNQARVMEDYLHQRSHFT